MEPSFMCSRCRKEHIGECADVKELKQQRDHLERENAKQAEMLNKVIEQRDELLAALEATVDAIRLFRNAPQLEKLVSLRATAGYVAMDAAMDQGNAAIAKAKT